MKIKSSLSLLAKPKTHVAQCNRCVLYGLFGTPTVRLLLFRIASLVSSNGIQWTCV